MSYKIKFNNGLGKWPVSLFVEVNDIKIFDTWDRIQEYNCRDVVFYGNVFENSKELNFLCPTLASNGYHSSIIIKELTKEDQLDLNSNRIIVFFNSDVKNSTYFKRRVSLLKNLNTNDIILLNSSSIKEFVFTRQYFINNEIKAKVMVKLDNFSKDDIIANKIYDIYLYNGEFYV